MGDEASVVEPWPNESLLWGGTTLRQIIRQFFLDLGWNCMVDRNWSYTALHVLERQESNGKPAKISGDKLVNLLNY
jgi:hypothetical protein